MRRTFMTIGLSLVMTSLVIIANFSVYLTSVAKVYVNLGLLTALGITAALLADGLVTPVLLKVTRAFGREGENFAASGEKEREEKELSCAA
jgi:predicted RND superfamily exporter protein